MGLITYLRTDSTRVSQDARTAAAAYITAQYGEKYLLEEQGCSSGVPSAAPRIFTEVVSYLAAHIRLAVNRFQIS